MPITGEYSKADHNPLVERRGRPRQWKTPVMIKRSRYRIGENRRRQALAKPGRLWLTYRHKKIKYGRLAEKYTGEL
jgi:hypothetical protein